MRPLGKIQRLVLACLVDHRSYHPGGGWYWDTTSGTIRIMESLVKRGLAKKERRPVNYESYIYTPTEAGIKEVSK